MVGWLDGWMFGCLDAWMFGLVDYKVNLIERNTVHGLGFSGSILDSARWECLFEVFGAQ